MGIISFVRESVTELDPKLTLVQVIDQEKEADKTGEYDSLKFEVQRDAEVEQEIASSEEEPAMAENGNEGETTDTPADGGGESSPENGETGEGSGDKPQSDDEETESISENPFDDVDDESSEKDEKPKTTDDVDSEKPSDEDSEEKSEKEVKAREAICNDYYDRVFAAEGFFDALSGIAVRAFEILKAIAVWLGWTALPFIYQKTKVALKYISAAVIWIYGKSVKMAMATAVMIVERYKRFKTSLAKRTKEINSLRDTLVIMKARSEVYTPDEDAPEPMYKDAKIIQWFTVGGKVSPLAATEAVAKFTELVVAALNRGMVKELQDLQNLLSYNQHGVQGDMLYLLRVQPSPAVFLKKSVKGYTNDLDILDTYVYGGQLPNSFLFLGNFPKPELRDLESVTTAYRKSGMMFGIAPDVALPPEEIPCLTIEQAIKLLNELERLCGLVAKQASFYKDAEAKVNGLKTNYRHFYENLVSIQERKTLHETMVEYVYLKQMFASRVYIPAVMDVHDFVDDFITHTLRYVKASIVARK